MYRIAWKNLTTGHTGHGDFCMTKHEAEESLKELLKIKKFARIQHWIESEDVDASFQQS